jgi:2-polyprenyl-3-methyl-5-hydroxy-6-metoxy-1,4-benzoquinol methylase
MTSTAILTAMQKSEEIAVVPKTSCFLCGRTGAALYSGLSDWLFGVSGHWNLRSCGYCSMAWLDPQPAVEDIPKLYSRYYTHRSLPTTSLQSLRKAASDCVLARMGYPVEAPTQILPRLLSHAPSLKRWGSLDVMDLKPVQAGTLLDVGCGNGEFIEHMRDLGWSVSGVDPDPAAVEWGRIRGLEVFEGTVADVPASMRYDVITLSHVIEHVPDPVRLLLECRRRLRPGTGTVVMTTPNIKSLGYRWFKGLWRGLEVPRHLHIFSPSALSVCVARSGLNLHSIRTETRLARMIYLNSMSAKNGRRDVGDQVRFSAGAKCASYAFQLLEEAVIGFQQDSGEEIVCVCVAPAENDGNC